MRQTWLITAIYKGKFVIDTFFENISINDFIAAVTSSDSLQRKTVSDIFLRFYPTVDLSSLWTRFSALKLSVVRDSMALEAVLYTLNLGGSLNPEAMLIGTERASGAVVVVKDTNAPANGLVDLMNNHWRIEEIAVDSRFRSPDSQIPVNTSSQAEYWVRLPRFPAYVPQQTKDLCQSAALEMLSRALDPNSTDTQAAIRSSLESMPQGAEAHPSRLEWAKTRFPTIKWESVYCRDISEAYEQLLAQIQKGIPAVLSTRLTSSGHVIVVVGVGRDASGRFLVEAFDPAGQFNFYRRRFENTFNQPVTYYLDQLYTKTQSWLSTINGKKQLSSYVVGVECWNPALADLVDQGCIPEGVEIKDWEWLGLRK